MIELHLKEEQAAHLYLTLLHSISANTDISKVCGVEETLKQIEKQKTIKMKNCIENHLINGV